MHTSTDLTLYEACEVVDSSGKGTGSYKLARRSLEPGLPYLLFCDHSHATPKEALACPHFNDRKFNIQKNAELAAA